MVVLSVRNLWNTDAFFACDSESVGGGVKFAYQHNR